MLSGKGVGKGVRKAGYICSSAKLKRTASQKKKKKRAKSAPCKMPPSPPRVRAAVCWSDGGGLCGVAWLFAEQQVLAKTFLFLMLNKETECGLLPSAPSTNPNEAPGAKVLRGQPLSSNAQINKRPFGRGPLALPSRAGNQTIAVFSERQ